MLGSAGAFVSGSSLAAAALALWPSMSGTASEASTAAVKRAPAEAPPLPPPSDAGVGIGPGHAVGRRIPVAYFTRDTASLRSASLVDADARSCDCRHPDASPAYGNVREYIRDNELMAGDKAGCIWRWLDTVGDQGGQSGGMFVYDQAIHWYRQIELD